MDRSDRFNDECGVFGIYDHPEAANLTYLGLYSLQHRGQESAGIVSSDKKRLYSHKAMGLVADIFSEDIISTLPGGSSIGHVRYSTEGASHVKNAQPFVVEYSRGGISIAHNGHLVNGRHLRDELEAFGSIFQSSMDTEVLIHLIASSKEGPLLDRLVDALRRVRGSYSLLVMTEGRMIAARDPNGFRPLAIGRLNDSYVVASETCAFDLIGAEYIRDVAPGEVIQFDEKGMTCYEPFPKAKYTPCVFEYIYFARPDSRIFGANVYEIRKNLGRILAGKHGVDADMVVAVPDSGIPSAIGYAEASGLPYELGIVRNHYVGRTFIEPQSSIRHFGVKVKLNAISDIIRGKRVVVVDDSIVRGTTSKKIIKMVRDAGAREVHMRISSPATISPCHYGIDTPDKDQLIAAKMSVDEINDFISADSLAYLSIDDLYEAVKSAGGDFCDACFTEDYPVDIGKGEKVPQLILFN